MRKVFFLMAALVSVAVFSSCAKKVDASAFVGKRLEAVSLYGKSVDQKAMMKGVFMVLDTANKVNGAAGCNNFFGGYETEGDMIKFGAAGMTRMMCDPLSMEAESQMVKLMGEADRFAVDGTTYRTQPLPISRFLMFDRLMATRWPAKHRSTSWPWRT